MFEKITGHPPFPWQEALFEELAEKRFRRICDVPTGLGKTSIITIWLLALAYHARAKTVDGFPRRLIYVVNRRTIVDQATREAECIRKALLAKPELAAVAAILQALSIRVSDAPLAISTLRGQFADNAEWRNDPARPAVIVGTVDMIGSRLLFSGYGCGFKSRPLHAGFLGQDTLLVHDEAHLEPAFQELLVTIESEQRRSRDFGRFGVIALTATSRSSQGGDPSVFTDKDRAHPEVHKRFEASKGIAFHPIDDEKSTPIEAIRLALEHKDDGQPILVFLRKLDHVQKVVDGLRKEKLPVQTLTGTVRGLERDAMATTDPIFARFTTKSDPQVTPQSGTVYLVSTSAGEVGVDISADHLICDLTPFDSMAQRFGRVNRFGDGDARIDVVHTTRTKDGPPADDKQSPFDQSRERTLALLRRLPERNDHRHDASPSALRDLPLADRKPAFTPAPTIRPATDILFDTWALTSVREKLPGRPPVADWLHGVAEWEPPETHVAWREEVALLTPSLREKHRPDDLLDDYPLKPHELLRDQTKRIFENLKLLATTNADSPVWIVNDSGPVSVITLEQLAKLNDRILEDRIVLLPPAAGGLKGGMLDGKAPFDATRDDYDVADKWMDIDDTPRRSRVWDSAPQPDRMRLVRSIDTRSDAEETDEDDENAGRRYWRWYVRPRSADDDGSRSARQPQELAPHLQSAASFAAAMVEKLGMRDPEASAVRLAAGWHDLGKDRRIWQHSIHNLDYPDAVLAKSGGKMRPQELSGYRHEFGSVMDLSIGDSHRLEFFALALEVQDLALHLIAAHHGRARPHFPVDEAFDQNYTDGEAAAVAVETPRRFARLQRKYGRWGLAYLESLVRAADALASQANNVRNAEPSEVGGIRRTAVNEPG
ncbi:MAG: type I-U CRISPR-associated helicase/endonuclease Cas3 [Candidatus Binataceae bacterium]